MRRFGEGGEKGIEKSKASSTGSAGERDTAEAAELAFKALKERPKLSIRMQIYFSFLFSFIIIFGIAIAHLINIYEMEKKIRFLEISNYYLFEIQQARRFEKNFFLYGTNLADALENVNVAGGILLENVDDLERVLGKNAFNEILIHLEEYDRLLQNLSGIEGNVSSLENRERLRAAEVEVRRHGQEIISSAQNLMQKEKKELDEMILTSRKIHILTFLFLFLFVGFITYFLGKRILNPINRFLTYTQRIGQGDFTPIMPARRYRDEFSQLAIAINQMIKELDHRQNILIESHKLRAIGTLTAGVAHELNNPINNITLTAHMLLEDYERLADDEKKEMVSDVIQEANRSQKIVRNLLDFARESESRMEPLDVSDVVDETLRLVKNQITLKGVVVDLKAMPNLPRIYGDKQQLCQVLLNLIINALDVTERNGKIQLLVVPSDDPKFIEVKVTDFGPGIPDHILPSIFDPFFTTKGKGAGTGLGLSVSQGLIAKHGGHIDVRTKVGHGTTFTVSMPITSFPADFAHA